MSGEPFPQNINPVQPLDVLYQVDEDGVLSLGPQFERLVRDVAREEIASLCGDMLRRTKYYDNDVPARQMFRELIGTALKEFGGTEAKPGD